MVSNGMTAPELLLQRDARQMRTDLGAERSDLIAQLARRARGEPQLQVAHTDRAELVERVDELLRRTRQGIATDVELGLTDVHHLGYVTDLRYRTRTQRVAVPLD